MKKSILTVAVVAGAVLSSFGVDRAVSLNTFAVNKVFSKKGNTMVAVPWTSYFTNLIEKAEAEAYPALDVSKIVNSQGLTLGDKLLMYRDNEAYYAWELQKPAGKTVQWVPIQVVTREGTGAVGPTNVLARGYSLWLNRQTPSGTTPFFVHGQYATNAVTITIKGGSVKVPSCTMIGNTDTLVDINLNTLTWTGVKKTIWKNEGVGVMDDDPGDRIVLPSNGLATRIYYWDGSQWYYTKRQAVPGSIGAQEVKVYDAIVPAGTGFWYVRNDTGAITVTIPTPSFAQ